MISVIVPVYNVKDYLEQCIQSIVSQTYSQFECILVDDGSNDGSGEICDSWQQKDSRIIVVHQENQGVSAARNRGLSLASNKYIYFLDADDFIKENLFEVIIQNNDEDCIIGEFAFFYNSSLIKIERHKYLLSKNYALEFLKENIRICIGSFLVKRKILINNNIYFDGKYKYGEDLEVILKILLHSKSVKLHRLPFVYYRQYINSAMGRYSFDRYSTYFSRIQLIDYAKKCKNTEVAQYIKDFSCIESLIKTTEDLWRYRYSFKKVLTFLYESEKMMQTLREASCNPNLRTDFRRAALWLLQAPYLFYIYILLKDKYYEIRYCLGKLKRKICAK